MNDINNNYEDDINYDMDYEENTEDDMNYENDISHGYKCQECGQEYNRDGYKCQECGQEYNGEYCRPCNSVHFHDNFAHWTSGDSKLDELIQNFQLNAPFSSQLIEWIEYSNLENIELIANGGFGSVYKAIWKDGPIINWNPWDMNKHKWQRKDETIVAVNITLKMNNLIDEIYTIKIYGVTRDLQNGEYAIVTGFKDEGNLRELIKKNHSELTWKKIIRQLFDFSWALWGIHDNNYYHKDLHSGNILNKIYSDDNFIRTVISDFGLSRPMDQSSTDKTSYGVLPFVAPEVLREYTPEPYAELMKRCWDPVPTNRPSAKTLSDEFRILYYVFHPEENESNKSIELDRDESSELNEDESNEINENESIELSEDESIELSEDESGEFSEEDSIDFSEDDFSELEIKEAFSQEREDKWKARLAELATNPIPLKKSQNLLTSKRLDFSESLSVKLSVEDWNKLRLTD
ncbi:kinase-like protein [Rhizophagus irregularis]|uniref:Kinase-like protein n=1 Tax=Rhizophagus irregularis TaxID=588596 RepID=A0A2I1H550_9GLOM|nr:kinase-like protein [Rhizophagus irregularis]